MDNSPIPSSSLRNNLIHTTNFVSSYGLSDYDIQNNLPGIVFSKVGPNDLTNETNVLLDPIENSNTAGYYETSKEYISNSSIFNLSVEGDEYHNGHAPTTLNDLFDKQPKDITFQPLNLIKRHTTRKKDTSINASTPSSEINNKRKAESSITRPVKIMKKDEVRGKIRQGNSTNIYANGGLIYIIIRSDLFTDTPRSINTDELINEAKYYYLPATNKELYYYDIPIDYKIPTERKFYNELQLTIHNIPFNIELLIEPTNKSDKDIIVNERYSDTQDHKLFVYNRSFTIFSKIQHFPWYKLSVCAHKSKPDVIKKKFIYPIQLKKYKFPIFDIPKLISLNTQVGVTPTIFLRKEIIQEKNLLDSICRFSKEEYNSLFNVYSEDLTGFNYDQKKDSNKHFQILKKIVENCDYKLWEISNPASALYGLDVELNIKFFLITLQSSIEFQGIGLNRNEPLSEAQIELISLITFIYENIVNIGFKYMDKYDKLIENRQLLHEFFSIEEKKTK